MNLSTSSFRSFVGTSLIFAAVLTATYSILLESPFFKHGGGVGSTDWTNCRIRGERYLTDLRQPRVVFIGTSLTARVRTDLLGADYYNLGFPCIGVLGGLEIVRAKSEKPKILVVELNNFTEEKDYYSELFSAGPPLWLKRWAKMFRTEYQLLPVAKLLAKQLLRRSDEQTFFWHLPQKIDRSTGSPVERSASEIDSIVGKATLEISARKAQAPADSLTEHGLRNLSGMCSIGQCTEVTDRLIDKIRRLSEEVHSWGGQLVLVDIPEIQAWYSTPVRQSLRDRLRKEASDLLYLTQEPGQYALPDGLHLAEPDAVLYTMTVRDRLVLR